MKDDGSSERDNNPITRTEYYGTTVSLLSPRYGGDSIFEASFYGWIPETGSKELLLEGDSDFLKFPMPATCGKYKARWDSSAELSKIEGDVLKELPGTGGKLTLTGQVTASQIGDLREALAVLDGEKDIELDFDKLTSPKTGPLVFEIGEEIISSIDNIPAVRKVDLPTQYEVKLGWNAFALCVNLQSITIPARVSLDSEDGGAAFWGSIQLHFEVAEEHEPIVVMC